MQKHHTDRLRDLKCNLLAFLFCLISRVCFNHLFLRELLIWFIFTSPSITVHCTCLVQIWKFYKTLNLILFFTDEWIHYHCSGPRPPDTVAVGAKDSPINFVAWNMRFFSVISMSFPISCYAYFHIVLSAVQGTSFLSVPYLKSDRVSNAAIVSINASHILLGPLSVNNMLRLSCAKLSKSYQLVYFWFGNKIQWK